VSIQVEGLKDNLRILGKIDPALRREFGKRFRELAKPIATAIDQAKPTTGTLPKGFQHSGRTGASAVKKVKININTRRARARNIELGARFETIGTVRVQTADAATAIADMAGKVGNVGYGGRTRAYPGRPNGHAKNGQGAYLISKLNKEFGRASRFMWPNAEGKLSETEREFLDLALEVEREINKELMKIGSNANEIATMMRRNS